MSDQMQKIHKDMLERLEIGEKENAKAIIFAALFAQVIHFNIRTFEVTQLLMCIDALRPETIKKLAKVASEEYRKSINKIARWAADGYDD
jgi:hypothetical protein